MNRLFCLLSAIMAFFAGCQATVFPAEEVREHSVSPSLKPSFVSASALPENSLDNKSNKDNNGYSVYLDTDKYQEAFRAWKDFNLHIYQVENFHNEIIERKINKTLFYEATNWIDEKVRKGQPSSYRVNCQTDRYLSISNIIVFKDRFLYYIIDNITIDVQTGDRVMLDDIIRVDDDLIQALFEGSIYPPTNNAFFVDGKSDNLEDFLSELTFDELRTKIRECSMLQTDFNPLGYIYSLAKRTIFHLEPGKIVISLGSVDSGSCCFYLHVDDIEEFLLVEKW